MRSAGWLALFALLYAAVVVPHFSLAYVDFGDGNYLYISQRLADGAVLYRDILAPQPPCHLLLGSLLVRLGRALGDDVRYSLYTVRAFSLLLHLATMLVVWLIARQLFGRAGTALWAAGLYLVIPVGFWWTLGYQSEPLEMFFLLSSFAIIVSGKKVWLPAAGLLAALAISTNMTAVPYVGWVALFLLWHDRRRGLLYALPAVTGAAGVVVIGEWLSGGHYLENVFFNQVGTFPHPDLWAGAPPPGAPLRGLRTILAYAGEKIAREGQDVLSHEGIFIAAAVAGLLLYLTGAGNRRHPSAESDNDDQMAGGEVESERQKPAYARSFVGWYAFWSFLSICFVSKGATEDYIFTIGEPFVCLFAAFAITQIGDRLFGHEGEDAVEAWPHARVIRAVVMGLGLILLFGPPTLWIYSVVHKQAAYELDDGQVRKVQYLIERNSKPGQEILGPPYYAFVGRRTLIEDFSELFIWQIKYGLEQQVEQTTGPATVKVNAIAAALRKKAIAVVVINKHPATRQSYAIEPIRAALDANYRSVLPRSKHDASQPELIRTLNTWIDVLAPVEGGTAPERL